jgi:hypothetical protein
MHSLYCGRVRPEEYRIWWKHKVIVSLSCSATRWVEGEANAKNLIKLY